MRSSSKELEMRDGLKTIKAAYKNATQEIKTKIEEELLELKSQILKALIEKSC